MTNGYSMSATTFRGRRYMSLYVYWSLAVNPSARKALLISYGIGTTAKALTDARQLESIDVVDISRDILELGSLAFPGTRPPLDDPRVRVHVEDGRFFLQTTDERFDLITAEPPPLRGAGITNLYSREYFQLAHDRLREGGVMTYWLPVNQLWLSETKAIIRGFCDAFPDCSLWSGAGLQWMLAGTRGLHGPVAEEQFTAQWRDPLVAPELAALGFEQPEALGATFLADAATLAERTRGVPPLDDDHPGRISRATRRRERRSDLPGVDAAGGVTPAFRVERVHPRRLAARAAPAHRGRLRAASSVRRPQRLGPFQQARVAAGGFDALVAAHLAAAVDGHRAGRSAHRRAALRSGRARCGSRVRDGRARNVGARL